MRAASPAGRAVSAGARWGVALGLFEIGLAAPGRWSGLEQPELRVLLLLVPPALDAILCAAVGLAAAGAAWLGSAAAAPLRPLRALAAEWAPAAAALSLGASSAMQPGILARAGVLPWALAAAGSLLAVTPPLRRKSWPWPVSASLAAWIAAGLAGAGTWLAGAWEPPVVAGRAPESAPGAGPDVVLVTWDTVRADVLSLYGGAGLETPALDALAARSAVFEGMTAVAPITGPAHASILTGLLPPSHGLRSNGTQCIAADAPTLAEAFASAGYDTAAFVAAYPLRRRFGFHRGFRCFDDRLTLGRAAALCAIGRREIALLRWVSHRFLGVAGTSLPGRAVLERAQEWLRQCHGPFLLWVHFFDAHGPHDPPPELLERSASRSAVARPQPADPERCAAAMTAWRAEILELDALLGELVAALEARDPGLRRTVLFLLADHGQCFGEGGYRNTHLPSLLEATQHVPALLHLPGGAAAGRRVAGLASQVDVAPTLCEAAGVKAPPRLQGTSWIAAALGRGAVEERPLLGSDLYLEAFQDRLSRASSGRDERKVALRRGEWKVVLELGRPDAPIFFRVDPVTGREEEARDAPAELRRELLAALDAARAALPVAAGTAILAGSEDRAALAALGYADDRGEER